MKSGYRCTIFKIDRTGTWRYLNEKGESMRLVDRLNPLWMTLALALPPAALAADQPAPAPSPTPAPPVEVTGFVDAYYSYNGNKPAGDAPYRNFDTKHDQAALSL